MRQKQIVTRTQIAKMAGTDATHFLNSRAGCVTKSLGDRAGLQTFGFDLINLPVGSVASEFHRHLYEEECVYNHVGIGVARIGPDMPQIEAGDFFWLSGWWRGASSSQHRLITHDLYHCWTTAGF